VTYEKWKNRADNLQQQLKSMAEHIPEIRWVGLIHTSGLRLGVYDNAQYQQNDEQELEEKDLIPIAAAAIGLSERISAPAGLGQWNFTVIAGDRAKIVAFVLNEEAVLVAIVGPSTSSDAVLTQLKSYGQRIVEF
jgi:predicted regulator of Ras-like GTPase activity (Roadblock/LC7/MglB family)